MAPIEGLRCVRCPGVIDACDIAIACAACGQEYPHVGRIPVLLPQPHAHVQLWRRQLGRLIATARETRLHLEESAAGARSRATEARLRAMAAAVGTQLDD